MLVAPVLVDQIGGRLDGAGEEAAPQRRIGDIADAEFAAGRQHFGLAIARPQRIFRLQRRDRMHAVRPLQRLRARLGEAQIADFALGLQLRHCARRFLDRHVGIDPVLEEEVDAVGLQATEACLAARLDRLGPAVAAARTRAVDAELGDQEHAVALALERPAQQLLVLAEAIQLRAVEEIDAELDGAVDGADRFRVVGRAVRHRHAHAAEPDGGDLGPVLAKLAAFHGRIPP